MSLTITDTQYNEKDDFQSKREGGGGTRDPRGRGDTLCNDLHGKAWPERGTFCSSHRCIEGKRFHNFGFTNGRMILGF